MDAPARGLERAWWAALPRGAARLGATAALGLFGVAAALLVARRLSGALSRPLDGWSLAVLAVVLVGGATGLRLVGSTPCVVPRALLRAPVTLAVALSGLAVSLPGTSTGALAAFWAVLVAGDLWGLMRLTGGDADGVTDGLAVRDREAGGVRAAPTAAGIAVDVSNVSHDAREADAREADSLPADDVWQEFRRVRDDDGRELLTGRWRADFATGERTAALHLAFCPPFERVPRIEVEQGDGPEARIVVGQILAHGARIDLKLPRPAAEPTTVWVEVAAGEEPVTSDE